MRILSVSLMFLFSVVFCQKTAAQSQSLSFEELQQRMLQLQRQMLQQMQNNPFNDPNFAMPKGDTTFFFRFDTTFGNGNASPFFRFDTTFEDGSMSHFFQFSPFGSDTTMQGDFQGFGHFFDQFFNSDPFFGAPDADTYDLPSDDGNQPKTEEDLLPEERLRQQDEPGKTKKNAPKAKPADPQADPRIKTIRI
ncbi:MAG: hypothetical protein KA165_18700 [Saprospiraceae bacterium]|nr:hypothetical protein [Saprospiraceae bacterium]